MRWLIWIYLSLFSLQAEELRWSKYFQILPDYAQIKFNDHWIQVKKKSSATFTLSYVMEAYYFDQLGSASQIKAIKDRLYLYNTSILEKNTSIIALDHIYDTANFIERILLLKTHYASLLVQMKDHPSLKLLSKQNQSFFFPTFFMENHPLGKAQWIEFYGYLLQKEEKAKEIFTHIEKNYLKQKDWIEKNHKETPLVTLNLPLGDVWYIGSDDSLIATYIQDAKGIYIPKNKSKGFKILQTVSLTPEDLIEALMITDVWIISSQQPLTKKSILNQYPYLKPFKKKLDRMRIYTSTKRLKKDANDLWERGDLYVDEILSDFILMIHPDLKNESKELLYFEKVL